VSDLHDVSKWVVSTHDKGVQVAGATLTAHRRMVDTSPSFGGHGAGRRLSESHLSTR
jgi:hypothetical protein